MKDRNENIWVTTEDNPFDPFTQFDQWEHFDERVLGYYTCGRLAHLAACSDDNLSEKENEDRLDHAIVDLATINEGLVVNEIGTHASKYRVVTPEQCVPF